MNGILGTAGVMGSNLGSNDGAIMAVWEKGLSNLALSQTLPAPVIEFLEIETETLDTVLGKEEVLLFKVSYDCAFLLASAYSEWAEVTANAN